MVEFIILNCANVIILDHHDFERRLDRRRKKKQFYKEHLPVELAYFITNNRNTLLLRIFFLDIFSPYEHFFASYHQIAADLLPIK